MDKKTFKRLNPLAAKIGDVLGGQNARDVETALGMLMSLQYETPDEFEEALENIRMAGAQYRVFCMSETAKHS